MSAVDARLASALEEQLRRRPDAERVGWKLGIGERERLGGIAVGSLTSATVLPPGAVFPFEGGDLHADAEIAIEIGKDGEIVAYAPALELVDLAGPQDDAYWAIAENVFHRAVAFGPWSPELPPSIEGALVVNDEVRRSRLANTDLQARLEEARRVLSAVGETLQPGDRVITGNVVQMPVCAGDHVAADLGPLGAVALEIG
jgi:2-keto-4-pentenoate hydratase